MVIAHSYTRLSTEKQISGHGKQRQEEAIQRVCDEMGWILSDKTYSDLGVSGWHGSNLGEKGALYAFIEAVRSGEIIPGSVLIVENVDRLSRQDIDKSVRLLMDILDLGIKVYTLADNKLYTSDSENKFMDFMVWMLTAQRAHEESEMKSSRVRAAKAKNKELMREGKIVTRKCPSWLKVSDDMTHFIEIKEISVVVQRVFTMYAEGWGLKPLALQLNSEGIKYWGKSPDWTGGKVRNLIKNKAVIGTCQPLKRLGKSDKPDGDPILNYYPPIITLELWNSCQALRATKGTFGGALSKEPMPNVFRGLLRCECGSAYSLNSHTVNGKKYNALRCANLRTAGCTSPNWAYRQTEKIILMALRNFDWSTIIGSKATEVEKMRVQVEQLRVQALEAEDTVDRSYEAVQNMPNSSRAQKGLEEAESKLGEIQADFIEAKKKLSVLESDGVGHEVWAQQLQQVMEEIESEPEARYSLNSLLRRRIDAIEFHSPDKFVSAKLNEFRSSKWKGAVRINFTGGNFLRIETEKNYKNSFIWNDNGTFTQITLN